MIPNREANITIRLSVMSYPIHNGFLAESMSFDWNQGCQKNPDNS